VIEKQPRKGLKPQQTSASARGKKLTVKQQQFINGKLKGLSSAKAAREAGYAPSVARKADAIITQSPAVRQAIEEILEEAGVTTRRLAQRMREGLDANLVHHETANSFREVHVDFSERREMVELALRVKGLLVDRHQVQMVKTLEEILEESTGARSAEISEQGDEYGR